jgi:drug/metabolite transporter (DMT)-like permease
LASPNHSRWSPQGWSDSALAWYFVIVWGSGFVATKIALQYTTPFVFLSMRYGLGVLCMGGFALFVRLRWPDTRRMWAHVIVAGVLVHAVNLGGSHYAQFLGMSAGTTALVLAVQPLLTAGIGACLGEERLVPAQWLGVGIGLCGVVLLVWHKIDVRAMNGANLCAVLVSLVGSTAGTLYVRHFCRGVDLRAASLIQFLASLAVLAPLALVTEGFHVRWSWQLLASAAYLVIGASILALNAFHLLMRRGQATRVASLMYLTPIIATLVEFAIFGVLPTVLSVAGMAVICAGVALVAMRRRPGLAPS